MYTTFEKISKEQWIKDIKKYTSIEKEADIDASYEAIQIPTRGSTFSAGYDFYIPYDFSLGTAKRNVILTGIRWVKHDQYMTESNVGGTSSRITLDIDSLYQVLLLYARSSVAKECGFSLANKVGVIDMDYCLAANEGHIMIIVDPKTAITDYAFKTGDRIVQGVISPFFTVLNDIVRNDKRTGGFGSTGK